jgi:hypothetical protein
MKIDYIILNVHSHEDESCFLIHTYIPLTLYRRKGSTHILPKLAMRNTADVTGGKPIAVWLQSILGVSAVNLLVAFDRGRDAIFLFYPRHHMRHEILN